MKTNIELQHVQNGYFSAITFLFDPKYSKFLSKKGMHAMLGIRIHTFFEKARAKKIIVLASIKTK